MARRLWCDASALLHTAGQEAVQTSHRGVSNQEGFSCIPYMVHEISTDIIHSNFQSNCINSSLTYNYHIIGHELLRTTINEQFVIIRVKTRLAIGGINFHQ